MPADAQPSLEKAKGISHRPTLSCCASILARCARCACMSWCLVRSLKTLEPVDFVPAQTTVAGNCDNASVPAFGGAK